MSKPTEKREVRYQGGLELRAAPADSNSPGTMVGYASVFNKLSEDLGYFREMIAPGAFTRTLGDSGLDVICYLDHAGQVLGRNAAGTLRLAEDDIGLRIEDDLPDTTLGRDVAVLLARGDLRAMSFAFVALDEDWDFDGAIPVRTILRADLYDVSVVGRPAYPDTSVGLRSLEAAKAKAALPPPAKREEPPVVEPVPALSDSDSSALDDLFLRLAEAE